MTQLEVELQQLRDEVKNMWHLVDSQLQKARKALINFDKDLAREVVIKEKRVNGAELKIDRDCEDLLALYQPVAIDLRFLLAVLKINSNLERIGDIAEGIAKYIIDAESLFSEELIKASRVMSMFDESVIMLTDTLSAFENEDTILARGVFKKDEFLDEINVNANEHIIDYLKDHPTNNIHDNLIIWDVEPSAENMLLYMQGVLNAKLPTEIKLLQVKLYETKDSFAEWIADD